MILLLALLACERPCDTPGDICTVMGTGQAGLSAPGGRASESALYWPADVTIGPNGAPWILDWNNHRLITLVDSGGDLVVERIAGNVMVGDGPWGGAASAALLNHPTNIAFAPDGTFVFAAWHNSRVVGVDPVADTTWLIGGNGLREFEGDGGPADVAGFDLPSGVAFGSDGTLYVADQANQRVRAIDPDGIVRTLVGNGEPDFDGDGGPAIDACLQGERSQDAQPGGRIAVHDGRMYIADTLNDRVRVVDLDTWIIDTAVGNGASGLPVNGADPRDTPLSSPRDVAIGPDGTLYVASSGHHCVLAVRDGAVETVAGVCGEAGSGGDRGPASEALLSGPYGIDVSPEGALWIADTFNHSLRRVNAE